MMSYILRNFNGFPLKVMNNNYLQRDYSSWYVYDICEKVCLGTIHYLLAGGDFSNFFGKFPMGGTYFWS